MKGNLQIKELSNQNGPDDKIVVSSFALRVKNFDDLVDSKTTLPLGKQQVFKFQIKEHFSQNDLDDKMVVSSFALRVKNIDDLADSKTTFPLGKTTGLHVSDKRAFQSE